MLKCASGTKYSERAELAKAKIPGTIYALIFKRTNDSEFELSLELRGNIETIAKIPELDDELVVQAALRMIEEYRIPASESGIQSLAKKLTRRFSKRPKTIKAKKRVTAPTVAPEVRKIVEKAPTRPKTATPDPEVEVLVAQLDAIKGEGEVSSAELAPIVSEQPPAITDELNKIIDRVSRFIQPLQDEIRQLSKRLTQLETAIHEQEGIAALEKKLNAMKPTLEKIDTLEAAIQRMKTQIDQKTPVETNVTPSSVNSAVQGPPVPASPTPETETDKLSRSIMRSQSFQDLMDFSEKLEEPVPSPVKAPDTAQDLVIFAQDLWKDGRQQQAIQLLETASRDHQNDPDLLLLLGRFHSHEGHIHEAVDTYDRALSFFPDDVRVLLALGDAYMALDRCEEAIVHLKRAQDLDPNNANIRARLSTAYLRMGQQAEAVEELKTFVEDSPDPEQAETSYGHSSAPLSLEALKRAELTKKAAQKPQTPPSQRTTVVRPEDPEKKKRHLKTLLDIEAQKSDT